jgi:hypothetical protein
MESKRNLDRLEPLGVDFDGNIYWNLSFYKGIVVESKNQDDENSKLFFFSYQKR